MSEPRNPLERLRARAAAEASPASVILAEGEDPRVVAAAERAAALGVCHPLLVGALDAVGRAAQAAGIATLHVPVLQPMADLSLPVLTAYLHERL